MRFAVTALALLGSFACAAGGLAQSAKPSSVRGVCGKLTVAGADATADCAPKLSSMMLPDGTSFFIFADGPTMVGFSGSIARLVRSGGSSILPVTFVNIGAPGREPNAIPANGSCRSGDLNAGPTTIFCTAETAQGLFEASFRSSGAAAR